MQVRIYLIILLIFAVGFADAAAQSVSKTGTSAGTFLSIPVGARSAALGGAVAASVNDPSAMRWNPGALTSMDQPTVMLDHADWLHVLRHSYLGIVLPVNGNSAVGLNITALTMEDMEETTYDQQDGTGRMFGAYSYAAGISYAVRLLPNFSLGANVKFINETIWNTSARGVAFDIGTTYVTPFDGIVFGVGVTNFGQKFQMRGDDLLVTTDVDGASQGNHSEIPANLDTDRFDLPLALRAGLMWHAYETEPLRLTVMMDGHSPSNNFQSVSFGAEVAFLDELVILRGGIPEIGLPDEDRMFEFALGAGLNYSLGNNLGLQFDYAYQQHKFLGGTNRISASVAF
ncbi:MAG: PorV/PorQ family protein [Cyclonatronaceae bacterium]